MTESRIPIENIYYLLCYAWNALEERDTLAVEPIEGGHVIDLLGQVLANGTAHLLKAGLDRGYVPISEDSRTIRGKINFAESVKRQLLSQSKVHVEYDELSYDVLHNRILKATLTQLVRNDELHQKVHDSCRDVLNRLGEVSEIELRPSLFRSLQLGRATRFYELLMRVCELIVDNLLPSEHRGHSRFRDFERDSNRMWRLFQDFVAGFFRREQDQYRVSTERHIQWEIVPEDHLADSLLPTMRADVLLVSERRNVIIDTKFYGDTLASNARFGTSSLHSDHMYQLYAYLRNFSPETPGLPVEGILLYPTVELEVDATYRFDAMRLRVVTLNLANEWPDIHVRLLGILPVTD